MAEQIVNEFTVNRPIDEAWPIICDLERIAPCMPGAQLEEVEGDTYRGRVKVKLGAVATEFKGEAHFAERDDTNHTATLVATGRDTKNRGNANVDVHASAEELSPTSTNITVVADLNITGRVAQFGRGIMGDVSKKLIDEFSSNLNKMIDDDVPVNAAAGASSESSSASTTAQAAEAATGSTVGSATDSTAGSTTGSTTATATDEPRVRKINGPAAEPIDVADYAGPAILKRFGPALLIAILVVLLVRRLR